MVEQASCRELKEKYSIRGIPNLVIIKPDGEVITAEGRANVSLHQNVRSSL